MRRDGLKITLVLMRCGAQTVSTLTIFPYEFQREPIHMVQLQKTCNATHHQSGSYFSSAVNNTTQMISGERITRLAVTHMCMWHTEQKLHDKEAN